MEVICVEGKTWSLQLENMGLKGNMNVEILEASPALRTLSLMNNKFEVAMFNVRKLSALKALYLSDNDFSGEIADDAFKGMRSLKKVLLANNGFTGKISSSQTMLLKLLMLRLEGNQFVGVIPDSRHNLKVASFANNRLEGPIPPSLSHMGAAMFSDLLRASAEVFGSGSFAASYKVVMVMYDEPVVEKRHKQMNNGVKQDFDEHMRKLGRLNHHNLLPLSGYHYMKDEKLLVSNCIQNGCLATHLNGNDKPRLDWGSRVETIKGVARGLSYLHKELPTLTLPYGNLKSSNVLLDHNFNPFLCDYGLAPVINQEQIHMFMAAYKSPEFALRGRISKKTDVWCLGILVLEIVMCKFQENYLNPNYDHNESILPSLVSQMVKEKKSKLRV
ncbi:Pollen receptor-like kinase 4 [Hibiscus syriacus]|uniref:Pollen receptor-like kinase 4 n=1 Tax=Hibiscus syriacus TaxID=106335 RepID=A0A6A2XDM4_HIBSY|nr:Pollen receptor-like kinase 4 [Hibiscus syriacus]